MTGSNSQSNLQLGSSQSFWSHTLLARSQAHCLAMEVRSQISGILHTVKSLKLTKGESLRQSLYIQSLLENYATDV